MKSRVLWPPVRSSAIRVALSASYCRQVVSSHYETLIETAWKEQAEGRLCCSPLFRLHTTSLPGDCSQFECRAGLTCMCEGDSVLVEDFKEIELRVGLTNTRESSITRHLSAMSSDLAYIGYELHKKPQMFLADSIDMHAIFVTKDALIPLVKSLSSASNGAVVEPVSLDRTKSNGSLSSKSGSVSSKTSLRAPTIIPKWSLPTGQPEPTTCSIFSYKDLVTRNVKEVHTELVESVFRFLREMLGLKTPSSEPTALLAIHYDKKHNNKPELVFILKSGLTSIELADIFKKSKAKNSYELAFMKNADLKIPFNENEQLPLCQVVERKVTRNFVETQSVGETTKNVIKLVQKFDGIDFASFKF